ncbi:MAG: hypothetical protein M0030_26480 [Actinomycetota bacterium]|nr:hypothetical protein [Actinomycetota bacterium]
MGGYANRFVRIEFPDLSEPGDLVWVRIRNPRTVPVDEMQSASDGVTIGPDGAPAAGDTAAVVRAGHKLLAKLIVDWHVYDATSTDDDQPALGLPATPELVARLPMEIYQRLGEELDRANPQKTPASREATGNES